VIALSEAPLDPRRAAAAVADPEHGGEVTFVGTTRREAGSREVEALHYDAYEELALSELRAIAREAEARYGARLALLHRVGRVAVGEPSVVVVASAPHRPAAFSACRYGIDELKHRVPIWKQTIYADGETAWFDGRRAAVARPA
jgi:molybdopterin synthase catalytic subunit